MKDVSRSGSLGRLTLPAATAGRIARTALVVGGILFSVISRRFIGRNSSNSARSKRGPLRRAIIGNNKRAILAVFGKPAATAGYAAIPASQMNASITDANVWYYTLDRVRRCALAIEFENDVARNVLFLEQPRMTKR